MIYIYTIEDLYRQRDSLYQCYKTGQITPQQYLFYIKPFDSVIDKHEMSIFLESFALNKASLYYLKQCLRKEDCVLYKDNDEK